MKLFTQRWALLALLFLAGTGVVHAQFTLSPRLVINGNANISGSKHFRYASDPAMTGPWGRNLDTTYLAVPLVKAFDTLGALPLVNGTSPFPSLVGKFALIYRGGGITFTQKAAYCQQAGAIGVIVVNNRNGGPVGMAFTAGYSPVTIPVLSISKEDGDAINAAIKIGEAVTVTINSGWGSGKTNDLAIWDYSAATPHAFAIPLAQVNTASQTHWYNIYNSAYIANYGSANQTNAKLKQTISFTPTGGSASTLYSDSVVVPSFLQTDSISEKFFSPRFYRPQLTSTGVMNINYTASANAPDENPSDNQVNYQVYVTDSIFCKSRWNPGTSAPRTSVAWRFGGTTPPSLIWGPLFYVNKGGYQPTKAQFAIAGDSDLLSNNTVQPIVYVYLYRWADTNHDGLMNGKELSIVATGYKSLFTNDSSYKPFLVNLNAAKVGTVARLQDTSWYFVAVQLDPAFALGADWDLNPITRSISASNVDTAAVHSRPEWWGPTGNKTPAGSPTYSFASLDTFQSASFSANSINRPDSALTINGFDHYTGLVPAIALHVSKTIPSGVATPGLSPITQFDVYPNPASTELKVAISLTAEANTGISIVNAMGQSVMVRSLGKIKSGTMTIPTANMPSGTYYLMLGTDAGSQVRQFTIVH